MFVFLRSLCVDALIELSDENADWKLSFDEFLNCLKPGFNPPEKSKRRKDNLYTLKSKSCVRIHPTVLTPSKPWKHVSNWASIPCSCGGLPDHLTHLKQTLGWCFCLSEPGRQCEINTWWLQSATSPLLARSFLMNSLLMNPFVGTSVTLSWQLVQVV